MKYVCESCGEVIDEEDITYHTEFIGYCHEYPCYQDVSDGCKCGGDYVEGRECDMCGEWYVPEDLVGITANICLDCLRERATLNNAMEFENETSTNLYDGFSYMGYGFEEIKELINRDIKERIKLGDIKLKTDIEGVCLGFNKDEFADFLKEKEDCQSA